MEKVLEAENGPTANKLDLAAMMVNAQSRLPKVPNRTQSCLHTLEGLLTSARDQVACGELLTHADIRRLNKAFDDLAGL